MYIVYCIFSLILSIFGLFRDFAPIPRYGENEKILIYGVQYLYSFSAKSKVTILSMLNTNEIGRLVLKLIPEKEEKTRTGAL